MFLFLYKSKIKGLMIIFMRCKPKIELITDELIVYISDDQHV